MILGYRTLAFKLSLAIFVIASILLSSLGIYYIRDVGDEMNRRLVLAVVAAPDGTIRYSADPALEGEHVDALPVSFDFPVNERRGAAPGWGWRFPRKWSSSWAAA